MKLTRQRRLRQWGEFQAVRQSGKSAGGRFLVVGTLAGEPETGQKFGFITSKKASKKAVVRNQLRRRFREIIRKWGDHLPEDQWVVTIARWKACDASYQELEADWLKTIKRLHLWQETPR